MECCNSGKHTPSAEAAMRETAEELQEAENSYRDQAESLFSQADEQDELSRTGAC